MDDLMTGDLEEDATRLESTLESIAQELSKRPDLAEKVRYRIEPNSKDNRIGPSSKDDARIRKFKEEYTGPDPETLETLDQNHQCWLQDPSAFWAPLTSDSANPQVKIVDRYLQANFNDA